jgi:hypothetical protein
MAKSKSYDPLAALRVVSETSAPSPEEMPAPDTDQSDVVPESSLVDTDRGSGRVATKSLIVAPLKPAPATGKETSRPSFYFYPEDVSKMRSLVAYIAGQHGIRINDSLIIRALLHLSQPGQPLIEAIGKVKKMDRRRSAKSPRSETHTI